MQFSYIRVVMNTSNINNKAREKNCSWGDLKYGRAENIFEHKISEAVLCLVVKNGIKIERTCKTAFF